MMCRGLRTALVLALGLSGIALGQGYVSGSGSVGSATSANTPNAVVKRDASGNFSAGTITATLSGSAGSFTGSLVGDVTGTQGATVVSTVGTSSAANVHAAELLANAAASANTASTIVKRDGSGNFSAGTITGTLTGNASGLSSTLAIGSGGTGQTSANAAFNALAPAQGSASGKYLTSNGTDTSWGTVSSGSTSTYAAYASRPGAGTAGNLFVCSNCPTGMWVDSGSSWLPLIHGIPGTQPKASSNFGQFIRNTGAAPSVTDRNGSMHYSFGPDSTGGASTHVAGMVETLSSSTAHVEGSLVINPALAIAGGTTSFVGAGFVMRESGSGKFAFIDVVINNNTASTTTAFISCAYWSSATTVTVQNKFTAALPGYSGALFMKLARSGSNILFQISNDATNWVTLQTTATATIFTTAPDQVGVAGEVTATADFVDADIFSYNSGS